MYNKLLYLRLISAALTTLLLSVTVCQSLFCYYSILGYQINLSIFQVSSFTVPCPVSIGKLLLIELDKQRFSLFPEEDWFPDKVEIKSPEEVTYTVPIYRWITDSKVHRFREGTGLWEFSYLTSCYPICCSL